jgi:ubiquinone/menaquinone biosynthesis C-methylase UbiE
MTNTKVAAGMITVPSSTRSDQVRSVFENVSRYVSSRGVDIRVRIETVNAFAAKVEWQRLLDVGCGNGAISLPLLTSTSQLTLMDLSAAMLATAQANAPELLREKVEIRNENFMEAFVAARSYDLIVCVGVLAHVDSPDEFISKIAGVLRPGGSLILGFTDSRHVVGRLARFMGSLKEIIAPARYPVNRLAYSDLVPIFDCNRLNLISTFRYAEIPLPGIERILPRGMLHRLVRMTFGQCTRNRNAWLGNEYICLLTRN